MSKSWYLFSGLQRRKSIVNCLRRLETNKDYTVLYDDGVFRFEQKKENTEVIFEVSIHTFYDICAGLNNKSEINNRINDFILQQLYLKSIEL
ncbi:hypothetical protein RZO55_19555 [Clostridium boliviensis]|uniref:Uncharacterized protein n=1 Tax=Clostridium boliviensis TaxID=318465 RepID=A0ABU4GQ54_9CLOT|nr:hypothetical protein [Clostridium boliviensis]